MGEPKREDHEALREFLASRDTLCPACNYSLRGLQGSHCPECGLELHLNVQLAEPAMGLLLTTLAGIFVAAGSAFLILVGYCWVSLLEGRWPWDPLLLLPILTFAVCAPVGVLLSSRSGRVLFRSQRPGARVGMAIAGISFPLVVFTIFMLVVMSY